MNNFGINSAYGFGSAGGGQLPANIVTGAGTAFRLPMWGSAASALVDSSAIQAGTGLTTNGQIGIEPTNSITNVAPYIFYVRNSYPGNASASQTPMVSIWNTSTANTPKVLLEMRASGIPSGSRISWSLFKSSASRGSFFGGFVWFADNSDLNYYAETWNGPGDARRVYGNANMTIGFNIPDNGFKLEVGGTVRINSQLTMGVPTATAASFNLPVGVAPTTPVDGDVWREDNTDTGLKIRVNGVTKTIALI